MFALQYWPAWLRLIFVRLPRFFWWLWGLCVPLGLAKMPWMEKRIKTRLEPLDNVPQGLTAGPFTFEFVGGFVLVDVNHNVLRSEALETIRQLRLDFFGRAHYNQKVAQQNTPDLKELTLTHTDFKASVSLYVPRYQGHSKHFDDFAVGDQVALLFQGDYPIFIYNYETHVLANCDIWDLELGPHGVTMPDKGKKLAANAAQMICELQKHRYIQPSPNARLDWHGHSYDVPLRVKENSWRDWHYKIFFVVFFGMMLFCAYCGVMGLLGKDPL